MAFSLIADGLYPSIHHIEAEELAARGITLLLADLDNTIAPYSVSAPTDEVRAWNDTLKNCGVDLFVLSNNRSPRRIKDFCQALGVPYIDHAGKPKAKSFHLAMERMGRTPAQTAMVGDQIFTDVLGAKNAGVRVLLVRPIDISGNPLRNLRFGLEQPFRLLAGRRKQ